MFRHHSRKTHIAGRLVIVNCRRIVCHNTKTKSSANNAAFVRLVKLSFSVPNQLVVVTNGTTRGCVQNLLVVATRDHAVTVVAIAAIRHTAAPGTQSFCTIDAQPLFFRLNICFLFSFAHQHFHSHPTNIICVRSTSRSDSSSNSSRSPSPNSRRRRFNSGGANSAGGGPNAKSPIPQRRHAKRSPTPTKRRHSPGNYLFYFTPFLCPQCST